MSPFAEMDAKSVSRYRSVLSGDQTMRCLSEHVGYDRSAGRVEHGVLAFVGASVLTILLHDESHDVLGSLHYGTLTGNPNGCALKTAVAPFQVSRCFLVPECRGFEGPTPFWSMPPLSPTLSLHRTLKSRKSLR